MKVSYWLELYKTVSLAEYKTAVLPEQGMLLTVPSLESQIVPYPKIVNHKIKTFYFLFSKIL